MQPMDYTTRRLIEAARTLAGEGLGFDPARHDATTPKTNLATFVERLAAYAATPAWDADTLLRAALERQYADDMPTLANPRRGHARALADSLADDGAAEQTPAQRAGWSVGDTGTLTEHAHDLPVGTPVRLDEDDDSNCPWFTCDEWDGRVAIGLDHIRRDADKQPAQADKPAPSDAEQRAREALREWLGASAPLDEDRVVQLIREHSTAPRHVTIHQPDAPAVTIKDHTHPQFDRVLALAAAGVNIMLTGPAGCGKTYLARQVAKALDRPFGSVSYTAGASETWLLGRMLPTGDAGTFEYHPAPFVELYEQPSVFLHDELDAADPNMLIIANSALANGHFTNPMTGGTLTRHADSVQISAVNTMGDGADATYTGREALDGATLDRWFKVSMDYDEQFERALAGEHTDLLNFVQHTRQKAREAGLNRVVSTRWIEQGRAALAAGVPLEDVKSSLLMAWSDDERGVVA